MGKGGGKNQQVTTQETQLPPWVTQAAQGNLSLANTLTDPFVQSPPDSMVAPFNAEQQNSFDMTRGFAAGANPITAADLGYSYYRGFADRAPYTMAKMGGIPQIQGASIDPTSTMSVANIGDIREVSAGKFTDADLNAYMNPYTEHVVDSALNDLRDEYGRTITSSDLSQAASGAFGGARHGIRDAQVANDHQRNMARTTSGLRRDAFNSAAGLIQGDQNRALQAAQANQSAAQQRALQQAQLQQEGYRYAADLKSRNALEQARLNQQTANTNANLTMQGRQADISSRYQSDQQRLGAVQSMANAALQAQQLEDQRILQNAALLNDIGNQQQRQTQAELDVPYRALEIRNNTLRGTPYPTTQVSTGKGGGGGGKGGLLGGLVGLSGKIGEWDVKVSHSSTKTHVEESSGVLGRLQRLPINYWSYKEGRPFSDGKKHISPMAEDVHEMFGVGDGLTLDAFDLLGIALSALKDLSNEMLELKATVAPQID